MLVDGGIVSRMDKSKGNRRSTSPHQLRD